MANSVMERICEKRKQDGFPALAIEWGAVGDVGLVAEMQEEHINIEISGTLQQQISNCLKVLDRFLKQKEATIVSSIVVAAKRGGADAADNIVDAVINILGLNDSKSVSFHATLAELGMDSMNAVEIKQTLERDFEVFLSAKDIRTLTLNKLKEIQEKKSTDSDGNDSRVDGPQGFGMEMLFRFVADETLYRIPHIQLKSKLQIGAPGQKVLLFPGIEGYASTYETLAAQLKAHVTCFQYRYDVKTETVGDLVEQLLPVVEDHITKDEPFNIICYSYGSLVALEIVFILESRGYSGNVISLDGAPLLLKGLLTTHLNIESEKIFQTALLCQLMTFFVPLEVVSKNKETLFKCTSWTERLDMAVKVNVNLCTHEHQKRLIDGFHNRCISVMTYQPSYSKLKSKVWLFKPKQDHVQGLPQDYSLSEYLEHPVDVRTFDGNHSTILENALLAEEINSILAG